MVDISWNSMPQYVRQSHFDSERMAGTVPAWKYTHQTAIQDTNNGDALNIKNSQAVNHRKAPSFSFNEFIDVINPLQHIPVVSTLYRNFTGDEISPVAQIVGGGLFGGVIGGVASLVNAAMQEHTGQSFSGHIATAFTKENNNLSVYNEIQMAGNNDAYIQEKREGYPRASNELVDDIEWNKPRYHFNT